MLYNDSAMGFGTLSGTGNIIQRHNKIIVVAAATFWCASVKKCYDNVLFVIFTSGIIYLSS